MGDCIKDIYYGCLLFEGFEVFWEGKGWVNLRLIILWDDYSNFVE